jgi:hypothetical protein
LSVASITNHSCVTSAGLALKVFMEVAGKGVRLWPSIGAASAGGLSVGR